LTAAIRRAHAGDPVFSSEDLTRVLRRSYAGGTITSLSGRETDVLRCLANGEPTVDIASALFISVHTVRSHVRHILEKLDAHSKLEAVSIALLQGIIDAPR